MHTSITDPIELPCTTLRSALSILRFPSMVHFPNPTQSKGQTH